MNKKNGGHGFFKGEGGGFEFLNLRGGDYDLHKSRFKAKFARSAENFFKFL